MGAEVRSDKQFLGIERSSQGACAKGAGLIGVAFERPTITAVEDGDPIRIGPVNRLLRLDVEPDALFRREQTRSFLRPRVVRGNPRHRAEHAARASQVAVLSR